MKTYEEVLVESVKLAGHDDEDYLLTRPYRHTKEILATAAEVYAAQFKIENQWLDIEIAPKDGTPVIISVLEGGDRMAIEARFSEDHWYPVWLDTHGCGCCGGDRPTPTHWIPLPKPPIS